MAIVTRQEFAEMCGMEEHPLRTYISRKNVIVHGDGGKLIDTTHPINKAFKDKRRANMDLKKEEQQIITRIPKAQALIRPAREDKDGDPDEEPPPPPLDENLVNAYLLEKRGKRDNSSEADGPRKWLMMKMKGDAQYIGLRVEREQLLLDKTAGKLMPIDLMTDIHKRCIHNIHNHYNSSIDNIAVKFCQMVASGDMEKYTSFMEACRLELTRCIDDAKKESEEDIIRLINNYAETRHRGEKKI